MNKQNGLLTAVFTTAATDTVILGIVRGIKKSFRPFIQTISCSSSPALQIPQAAQGMMNGQASQNITKPLQKMINR